MEIEDCAFPLVAGIVQTDDANVAFKDADFCLLVGASSRPGHGTQGSVGSQRSHLLGAR